MTAYALIAAKSPSTSGWLIGGIAIAVSLVAFAVLLANERKLRDRWRSAGKAASSHERSEEREEGRTFQSERDLLSALGDKRALPSPDAIDPGDHQGPLSQGRS
jgi:hypothetical protein